MDPITGTIAAAGIGAVGGFAESIFGSGSQVSGLEIPGAYEIDLLSTIDENITQIEADRARVAELAAAYETRTETYRGILEGTIPNTVALNALRDTSASIALNMGQSTQELVANGFLDQEDVDDLAALEKLDREDFADPALEAKLAEQKARLEQELTRDGVGPSGIAQALTQFEQDAEISRFQRANELRRERGASINQRIGIRSGLREQGFNRATQGFSLLSSELNRIGSTASALQNMNQNQLSAGANLVSMNQALRGERFSQYQALGEFDLSKNARRLIERGIIGPGPAPTANNRQVSTGYGVTEVPGDRYFGGISNEELMRRRSQRNRASSNIDQQVLDLLDAEAARRGI